LSPGDPIYGPDTVPNLTCWLGGVLSNKARSNSRSPTKTANSLGDQDCIPTFFTARKQACLGPRGPTRQLEAHFADGCCPISTALAIGVPEPAPVEACPLPR
jgi:hypothetical protein